MGMTFLDRIAAELVAGGLEPETPVAIVMDATTARQRVLLTRLDRAQAEAKAQSFGAPAIVAVGRIAALQPVLAPFAITLRERGR